jgi:hypothetical protein
LVILVSSPSIFSFGIVSASLFVLSDFTCLAGATANSSSVFDGCDENVVGSPRPLPANLPLPPFFYKSNSNNITAK